MKITFIQVLLATMITGTTYSSSLKAQDVLNEKITISLNNTSLLDVIKQLQKSNNIRFIYSKNAINVSQLVSGDFKNRPLKDVLNEVLKSNGIDYELIKNRIILGRTDKQISDNGIATATPVKNISGTVVDEKDLPLPGVTIKDTNTGKSTVTDISGKFSLDAKDGDVLSFSFVGYVTQTQKASNGLNIKLLPASESLGEVVVIGYGTQGIKEVTSSVAHVEPKEFRQSGSRNALDVIQGKVPGLTITRTSGTNPNSGVSVQLRGAVTVTGSASPLIVIDGIPGGNLDLIQQDDIESIDVLKDGSGAAIYGTSANAGVILITTKKGKPGPPRFDYSSYVRKEYLQRRPDFLTADEFRQHIATGDILQKDFGHSTDFFDGLINHGNLSQNHNLALSGGTDKSNYRASINYRDVQG
ncbi:MAG: TonB-dependent receptor plug domain-containing protein, partial [Mucilaginibacter sp.]